MRNFELTPIECQKLKKAHRHAKEKWAADRLKAIYLLGTVITQSFLASSKRVLISKEQSSEKIFYAINRKISFGT
ncbi:MAG: hypothetical protein JSS07_08800 [Proteobacteria bacterium]|nr:hypothetical protein [Pseudomonadota bacterium]